MAYQIDFFPVGDGEHSGDAIAMRFGDFSDPMKTQVVVIDGGFQSSGEALVKHIIEVYGTTYVDVVVSTHPDRDHSSGLSVVLESLNVGQLWMHKPWEHTQDIAKMFKDGRVTDMGVAEGIRRSLEDVRYLETVAARRNIPIVEPFTGVADNTKSLIVLGPSVPFYESLLPDFRCTPTPNYKGLLTMLAYGAGSMAVKLAEGIGFETLTEPEGTHAENNSSVILLLVVGEDCILFTADAGVPALNEAAARLEGVGFDFNKLRIVQIPHHGSKHTGGPQVLDRLLGPKRGIDVVARRAVVSVSADAHTKGHPSRRVMNAFCRRAARAQGTLGRVLMFEKGAPRAGWTSVPDIPFYDEVED
jgi:beta-lactamase superfamily II metal-dependent hydrolase